MNISSRLLLYFIVSLISSEADFELRNGCPFFDINSQIKLLKQETYFNANEKLDVYIKGFIDKESLFNSIRWALPSDLQKRVEIKDIRYLHPSSIWLPEKNLYLTVIRVWVLSNICYIYTTFYDKNWKEVTEEIMIGSTKVPSVLDIPSNWNIENTGPEDGRLFKAFSNEFFIAFNMRTLDLSSRPMFIYSYTSKKITQLFIPEHRGNVVIMEKNWSPLIIDEKHMYFVYNFENLQIIDCNIDGNCIRVNGDYKWKPGFLRGGSPFVRFRDTNYYIAFSWTHSELPKEDFCYLYRPALTVIYAKNPNFEFIYSGEPIDFQNKLFLKPVGLYDSLKDIKICDTWLMSNSIANWDTKNDIADIIFTHRDQHAIVVKVTGLTPLIEKIIKLFEGRKLPKEDHCADKLLYFYYNRNDLGYPGKGREEKEFEQKIAAKIQKEGCQIGFYLDESKSCKSNDYLGCPNLCAECKNYEECNRCDTNSWLVLDSCVCKDGFYYENKLNSCEACMDDCAKCSAIDNCLACKDPNAVTDNGFCKCVEGFINVYNKINSKYTCEAYDPNRKIECYKGHLEIDKNDYQNNINVNIGYSEKNDQISMYLSTQKLGLENIEENKLCNFENAQNKAQSMKTSWIEDGYEIEIEVKIKKLK